MPGDENRNVGTQSAPCPNDGNSQLNTNTTDKAKTSSTEGEVRAVLVSFQSETSTIVRSSRCDSSDVFSSHMHLSQRDTTNVAIAATDEHSVTKRSKLKVRLSHVYAKECPLPLSAESAEVRKGATELGEVAVADKAKTQHPDDFGADETDPVERVRMQQKRSSNRSPSWKERCTSSQRHTKRIKVPGAVEAFLHDRRRTLKNKSSKNDAAGTDFTSIHASTDTDSCSQPIGRAEVDHVSYATTTAGIAETQCYNLAPSTFDPSKLTVGISPYDDSSQGNVLAVSDYVTDIYQRLYHREVRARYLWWSRNPHVQCDLTLKRVVPNASGRAPEIHRPTKARDSPGMDRLCSPRMPSSAGVAPPRYRYC
jgi:hypothetical protein